MLSAESTKAWSHRILSNAANRYRKAKLKRSD